MSIRKPFNQQLHDENDPKARQAVMKFIRQCGLTAVENENIYGIDLFISGKSSTGHVYNKTPVEVERRECWNNERFPFSTVHIPKRKEKFFRANIVYAIVNKTYDRFMFCYSNSITNSELQEVSNKYITKGEYFYNVPLEKWGKIYKKEG